MLHVVYSVVWGLLCCVWSILLCGREWWTVMRWFRDWRQWSVLFEKNVKNIREREVSKWSDFESWVCYKTIDQFHRKRTHEMFEAYQQKWNICSDKVPPFRSDLDEPFQFIAGFTNFCHLFSIIYSKFPWVFLKPFESGEGHHDVGRSPNSQRIDVQQDVEKRN